MLYVSVICFIYRCYVCYVNVTCVLDVVLDIWVMNVSVLVDLVLRLVGILLKLIEVRCGERTKYLTPLHHRQVDVTVGPGILTCHGENFVPK